MPQKKKKIVIFEGGKEKKMVILFGNGFDPVHPVWTMIDRNFKHEKIKNRGGSVVSSLIRFIPI